MCSIIRPIFPFLNSYRPESICTWNRHNIFTDVLLKNSCSSHQKALLSPSLNTTSCVFRSIALVVGVYAVCTVPFCVGVVINTTHKSLYVQLELLRLITTLMAITNCALNPIIYGLRMKTFKVAFKYLLHCNTSNSIEDVSASVSGL